MQIYQVNNKKETPFSVQLLQMSKPWQRQCCCPRGKSLSSRISEDQFTSPCLCPCPWTTKSLKIFKEFVNYATSVNSVTATVKFLNEDTVKNVLLTDVRYYLLIGLCHQVSRPSPRPRGSARRKTASSLILHGRF